MISSICAPHSRYYTALQASTALGGTVCAAAAVIVAVTPAAYAATTLALPIALGVGSLLSWVFFTALLLNRCSYEPKAVKREIEQKPGNRVTQHTTNSSIGEDLPSKNARVDKHNIRSDVSSFKMVENCSKARDLFLHDIQKDLEEADCKLLTHALNDVFASMQACASEVKDETVLSEIESGFNSELNHLKEIAQALKEGKREIPTVKRLECIVNLSNFMHSASNKITEEQIQEFENLLDQLENINQELNGFGDTALMLLAKMGKPLVLVTSLAKKGADFNHKETFYGNTPLIWAIANAHNTMAMEILKHPQNVNIQDNGRKNTALLLAVAKGYTTHNADGKPLEVSNLQIVQKLLEKGADPQIKDSKGQTALKLAVIRRDVEMVQALLGKGAQADFDVDACLNLSYEQASDVMNDQAMVSLINQNTFENSKEKVRALFQ